MKKLIYILGTLLILSLFSSCRDDDPDSTSIFDDKEMEKTDFDIWLENNYVNSYNIDFKYRFEDIESDHKYDLVPAQEDMSRKMAILIKYLWLETYDEVSGPAFTKIYIPKVINLVGSPAYNSNGTMVLGTAEGGLKVTLYDINRLDQRLGNIDALNDYYFHTMHHEFAHIFHQTKNYNPDFRKISGGNYVGSDWNEPEYSGPSLSLGFITPYSRQNYDEDFVEIYSTYITQTQEWWDAQLVAAGASGAAIIDQKITMVKEYMLTVWEIDLDVLREIVLRRSDEAVNELDLNNLK